MDLPTSSKAAQPSEASTPGAGQGRIEGRTIIRWLLSIVFFALFLKVAAPFIEGLLWAMVFVIVVWPVFVRLRNRTGLSEFKAALTICATAMFALFAIVFPILFELTKEAKTASDYLTSLEWKEISTYLSTLPNAELFTHLIPNATNFPELVGYTLDNSGRLIEFASLGFQGLGKAFFNLCIGLFLAFFFFVMEKSSSEQVNVF
jgi:predicted PurR-regulated permease PerM